ncbi:sulfurtransferase TusA family protein [Buchnera aphidicola (Greenidea ficicola)]
MKKKDILNIIGSRCPDSIINIRNKIKKMKKLDLVLIISDDKTTKYEIPKFCVFMKHKLLFVKKKKKNFIYLIQK